MRTHSAGSLVLVPVVLGMLTCVVTRADAAAAPPDLAALAARAVLPDAAASKEAVAALRRAGPTALAALMEANADTIRRHTSGQPAPAGADENWARVKKAIDAVAAQKDAYASGLYWYTDLDAAKSAARESGKPILSLRLLGTLDSEFSCANSRFFRTALYANQEVSQALGERFVLHWKSVRPVPKVTIDFGDGRKVERTITGNSIHYVLDAEGRVIDGLPGLYGPKAFLALLDDAAAVEKGTRGLDSEQREQFLRNWHGGKTVEILKDWQTDLRSIGALAAVGMPPASPPGTAVDVVTPSGLPAAATPDTVMSPKEYAAREEAARRARAPKAAAPAAIQAAPLARGKAAGEARIVAAVDPAAKAGPPARPANLPAAAPPAAPPAAVRAAPLARGKAMAEARIVAAVDPAARNAPPAAAAPPPAARAVPLAAGKAKAERRIVAAVTPAVPDPASLQSASSDETWQKLAALPKHVEVSALDRASRTLMASKLPDASRAGALAAGKRDVEMPIVRVVRNFERSIAEDTVRNEYTFHREIHGWLATGQDRSAVDALNERVYAELFLTPSSDPWLGLLPPDTYTALENDGFCEP